MNTKWAMPLLCVLTACSAGTAGAETDWWNPTWRVRTTVTRTRPYRDAVPRPTEVAVDFPLLLEQSGIRGRFDPKSVRVVRRDKEGAGREVPFACRTELDARQGRRQAYLTWMAEPEIGKVAVFDLYFGTKDRRFETPHYPADLLPPENLLANPGFEDVAGGLPDGWTVTPQELVRVGQFAHTTGQRSLKVVVDENTPKDAPREVTLSQRVDVRKFAGQEMVFECDLLAERAAYGAPVSIELEQLRQDGSRIPEYAVQPRWLSIELAQGQLVQFRERGRFSHEAATVNLRVRMRCSVRDADTGQIVTGPQSFFTVWVDRLVVRPGERWAWPAESSGGFVEGAIDSAPLNRGFAFTGLRRIALNGASEGTLTAGQYNPNPKSVHWGLQAGTLEFWCRPRWNADDGAEHVFFDSVAYGHRLQSRLRKLDAGGRNQLEFTIADAGCTLRSVRGPAPLRAGRWHHLAATWDFPRAHLQLWVDGKLVAADGPHDQPWPSSLVAVGGPKKTKGIGIMEADTRSMPMQAFIGGDKACGEAGSAEAVLDELRISDVVRYQGELTPQRDEFEIDEHTRALFHFENEIHGVHDSDDRFVRGHLACELPRQEETVPLEVLGDDGRVERRMAAVKPHAPPALFEANRAESKLVVTRPFRKLPDPRFVEHRVQRVERIVTGTGDPFVLQVGGDLQPLMRCVTFEHGAASPARTTPLPRWRANDNVVPFSVESLGATLVPSAASDRQKAFEAFKYALAVTNYYDAHYCETLPTRHRPRVSYTLTKALNVYPFDQCGPLNHMLRKLFLAAGISSNNASGTHHQFQQAFYEGGWRLFDLSPRKCWLNRDNLTVASRRQFEDDLYLKLRQGDGVGSGIRGRVSRATFGAAERPHSMDFPLHPGQRVSVCWHNEGRWFERTDDRQPIPLAKIPPSFGNGAIQFRPTGESKAAVMDNLVLAPPGGADRIVHPEDPTKPASLIYRVHCPYILSDGQVSGRFEAAKAGALCLSLSFDEGKTWTDVWSNGEPDGPIAVSLLEHVTARYAFWLKLAIAPDSKASVRDFQVRTTFVVSPLSLPGKLSLGENRIRFVGGPPTVPVRTTCQWVERRLSELGVSLGAISYYLNGNEAHRNLLVAAPGEPLPVKVTLQGRPLVGEVSLAGLPEGWIGKPLTRPVNIDDPGGSAVAELTLHPQSAEQGQIQSFCVVVRDPEREVSRRVEAQILVADAPLVREAEEADETSGAADPIELGELSGAHGVRFSGKGHLAFDFTAASETKYALWLRARWEPETSTGMRLALDRGHPRQLRATAMIGFTDWTSPRSAHTKMFAHFGEQYGHWSWYRIPDVELAPGSHRLTLAAEAGACFDALVLLPQNPRMDRAAMNLFQNWNYAPWHNPL